MSGSWVTYPHGVCATSTSTLPGVKRFPEQAATHTEKGTVVKEASTGRAKAITLNVKRATSVACHVASKAFDINFNRLAAQESQGSS